jgi:23S rRNA pseudouridine1911/1915/1917 synthase
MAEEYVEIQYVVEPNYAGWRLDHYLCEKIGRLSRARIQRIIKNGLVAERTLKPSTLVQPGLRFAIRRRAQEEPETPKDLPTLYEDDALLVLNKPAGLPIHPTARYQTGTLTSLLRERNGGQGGVAPVHRLDRETSGVIVCAKGTEACRTLMRAFVRGDVHKEYLALTEGWPPADQFTVDAAIAEGTQEVRIAVRIDPVSGKPAQTRFVVEHRMEKDGERFAWLRAFPLTGRQHQIRVHLKHHGYPLVGDKVYGPDPGYFDRFSKHCLEPEAWERLRLPRQALHAAAIEFPHPVTKAPLRFEAPLPEDLAVPFPLG